MTKLKLGQMVKDLIKNINDNFTELDERRTYTVLYNAEVKIPAVGDNISKTITLADDLSKYDGVILQLKDCNAYMYFGDLSEGVILKPVHNQMDFTDEMFGWNMFAYNCEILSGQKLKFNKFVYSGSNYDKNNYLVINELRYLTVYSVYPLTKVIGIKIN